ncbi:hypothetical protein IJX73_00055 [bacterium]|nr:hypothetical protein [bacterium]MBQ9149303.1 hypothetical protein [bacterium]
MKLSPQILSFKGYDAAPLKRVFLDEKYSYPFACEMEEVAQQENFAIGQTYDCIKWAQDDKVIIERNSKPFLVSNGKASNALFSQMRYQFGIDSAREYGFTVGGNTFIGKYPNGKKWLMLGENEKKRVQNLDDITSVYDVDIKNVFFIPQQDFHLDMFLRPIGYPYVLVNDPELVRENIKKYSNEGIFSEELLQTFEKFDTFQKKHYSTCDKVCKRLESLGFKPIRIAGVYSDSLNFMNALVNKHPDGKISYITNSSECVSNQNISNVQKVFEQDLRSLVPNLDKIYFIKGRDSEYYYPNENYMMATLQSGSGGLHCMSLEEPDFSTWA